MGRQEASETLDCLVSQKQNEGAAALEPLHDAGTLPSPASIDLKPRWLLQFCSTPRQCAVDAAAAHSHSSREIFAETADRSWSLVLLIEERVAIDLKIFRVEPAQNSTLQPMGFVHYYCHPCAQKISARRSSILVQPCHQLMSGFDSSCWEVALCARLPCVDYHQKLPNLWETDGVANLVFWVAAHLRLVASPAAAPRVHH